ncbi:hypothetical protein [Gracilibacillus massiliensis]|uniref:hypothetical protein n=1 Tax=Gracilibacillus massiliensis TaxID=1564956 RepID=UPI00071DF459|nr:hypothetical protein [Gracilibacillus massiliensis]
MTSFEALLFWYPVIFVLLGTVLGLFFKSSKLSVLLIFILGFFLSNLMIFYFTEGGYAGIEMNSTGKGLAVFKDLSFLEILSMLLSPNVYTLIYVVILLLSFVIFNLIMKKKQDY